MNEDDENGKNDSIDVTCKMNFNKEEIERDEKKNIRVNDDKYVWMRKRIMLMNDYTKGLVKSHYMNQRKITKGDAGNVKIKMSINRKPNNGKNRRIFGVGQGDWNAMNNKQFTMGYKGKMESAKYGVWKSLRYTKTWMNGYEGAVKRAIKGIIIVSNMNTEVRFNYETVGKRKYR
ncbi:6861_t:CDS:2, partial [Gigaspora margarita]